MTRCSQSLRAARLPPRTPPVASAARSSALSPALSELERPASLSVLCCFSAGGGAGHVQLCRSDSTAAAPAALSSTPSWRVLSCRCYHSDSTAAAPAALSSTPSWQVLSCRCYHSDSTAAAPSWRAGGTTVTALWPRQESNTDMRVHCSGSSQHARAPLLRCCNSSSCAR